MSKSHKTHRFFCLACGEEGIPLARRQGHQYGKFHRKDLYCYHCRQDCNHIECKTDEDVFEFKTNFENGVYKDEAEESLSYVGTLK